MNIWLTNPSTGRKDTMLSLSAYAFLMCAVKFLLNGVAVGSFTFGTVDAALIGALLGPTLIAYSAKKFAKTKTTET
jgi:hypothetical protein